MSDAALWGLLAAGLGILANNTGHYGAAGPAIGKGGLVGVDTFLKTRQQGTENQQFQDKLAAHKMYQEAQIKQGAEANKIQGRRVDLEAERLKKEKYHYQEVDGGVMIFSDGKLVGTAGEPKVNYKEREVPLSGNKARAEISLDGGKTWQTMPGSSEYDLKAKRGGTDVDVKLQVDQGKAFTGPIADEVSKSYSNAKEAVSNEHALQQIAKNLNDSNLIAGIGAKQRMAVAQALQLLGGSGADVAVTRSTIQGLAELALQSRSMLKGQGQVTEYEQKLLEKARSGDITMTVPELKALVGVLGRANRARYDSHVDLMGRLKDVPGSEQGQKMFAPPEYPSGGSVKRYNPNTGKIE